MRRRARGVEVEWQLEAPDLETVRRGLDHWRLAAGWQVTAAVARVQRDTYLDTAGWHLHRAGLALRVRRVGAAVEATAKTVTAARGGLARRRELTTRLADARLATVTRARGAAGRAIRRAAGTHPLRRLFALRTRRRAYGLYRGGRLLAEIVLDRTEIRMRARRRTRLARIEVEVLGGDAAAVASFVATIRRRWHLRNASGSKFAAGLAAARLVPPRRR